MSNLDAPLVYSEFRPDELSFQVVGSSSDFDVVLVQSFSTGSVSPGYTFNSLNILFADRNRSPEDLTVDLYDTTGQYPTTQIQRLNNDGGNPTTAGVYSFSASAEQPISLAPDSRYFFVLRAQTADDSNFGTYQLPLTEEETPISEQGWAINDFYTTLLRGGAIGSAGYNGPQPGDLLFSIDATPVPEPHEYAILVGLGLGGWLLIWRVRRPHILLQKRKPIAADCP